MRLAFSIADLLGSVVFKPCMSKEFVEEDVAKILAGLQAVEDYLEKNGNAESAFMMGTKEPT